MRIDRITEDPKVYRAALHAAAKTVKAREIVSTMTNVNERSA